jgi:hypothetical protein
MVVQPLPSFLTEQPTLAWLAQFRLEDQPLAAALISRLVLVSHDEFATNLKALLTTRFDNAGGPVGLYAERELPMRLGVPHRLFKEARKRVRRATGLGPQPVRPTRAYDPEVGSEGIVAWLITELCRSFPDRFFNHPGPNEIRRKKIRRFVVVTDMVGSGRRARTYLEAAWRVRSVRSWWSWHLFQFEVDLPGFFVPMISRKMAPNPRGAHEEEPIH